MFGRGSKVSFGKSEGRFIEFESGQALVLVEDRIHRVALGDLRVLPEEQNSHNDSKGNKARKES